MRQRDKRQRRIDFAGHQWVVKAGCGKGPGPNCWSDSEKSVWIDNDGRLHLKIRKVDGIWHSAEVRTVASTKYGVHRFYLIGRPDLYDKNVIASPFLYIDDNHEIDIEFSKWGEGSPTSNTLYCIQPCANSGNIEQFNLKLAGSHSTHTIDWTRSAIRFTSIHGHHKQPPTPHHRIREWIYKGKDNPSESDGLKIHINLWLLLGKAPTNGQEVELIVSSVESPHHI